MLLFASQEPAPHSAFGTFCFAHVVGIAMS